MWQRLIRAPRPSVAPTGEAASEAQSIYIRLARVGAVHVRLSYTAGGGQLSRAIDSLLEAERAVAFDDEGSDGLEQALRVTAV